jgi:hypothetical protein
MASIQFASGQTPAKRTIGTAPTPLFPEWTTKPAFWIQYAVLDMGTSTWCYVGDRVVQADGLFSVTDFSLIDVPPGYVFDAARFFAISENGDVVLGVTGMFPEG